VSRSVASAKKWRGASTEFGYPEIEKTVGSDSLIEGVTLMLLVDLLHWSAASDRKSPLELEAYVKVAREAYGKETA
jgi:hypothetical protein